MAKRKSARSVTSMRGRARRAAMQITSVTPFGNKTASFLRWNTLGASPHWGAVNRSSRRRQRKRRRG
jgi:hypothetical protein